jgi:hypothetical protein
VCFIGYSPLHKGFKCLDFTTWRVYVSRDVVLDENVFLFTSLHPNDGRHFSEAILLLPQDTISSASSDRRVQIVLVVDAL